MMDLIAYLSENIMNITARLCKVFRKAAQGVKLATAVVVETMTGRRCEKCEHYAKGSCWHPDFETRDRCITSVRPVGYTRKERPHGKK